MRGQAVSSVNYEFKAVIPHTFQWLTFRRQTILTADNDGKNRTYYILLGGYKLVTRLWKTTASFEAIYGIYGQSVSCTKTFHPDNTETVWPHTWMYRNVSSHTSRVESTQDPSKDKWVAGLSYAQVNPHTVLLCMKRHERNRHKGISLKTCYILCFQLFMFWKR